MQCTSKTVLGNVLNTSVRRGPSLPPSFLLPAFAKTQTAAFSSSPVSAARKDNNTRRGMSAIRRTGLNKRFKLSVKLEDLPQPVLDPKKRSKLEVDDDHGLWGFFDDKKSSLLSPEVLISHGRGWKRSELRRKSWEDLWKLWWTCIREVNRVKTYEKERKRLNAGYGEYEATARVQEVRKTQTAIKHTLTERWYQFENARELAMLDPEINLYADTSKGEPAYIPKPDDDTANSDDALEDPLERNQLEGRVPPETTMPRPEARS